jgi:hypothetical protein
MGPLANPRVTTFQEMPQASGWTHTDPSWAQSQSSPYQGVVKRPSF